MSPDPKQLAVFLDMAREVYGDNAEQVRWLEHPNAIRKLLSHAPSSTVSGCLRCAGCEARVFERGIWGIHDRKCHVMRAWYAIGDQRAARNIELAHGVALLLIDNQRPSDWYQMQI